MVCLVGGGGGGVVSLVGRWKSSVLSREVEEWCP